MLAGSPGYQSPEQLRAEKGALGPAVDVYSFGAVMVVTLKKCVLWPGLNCYQIMQKVTSDIKPDTLGIPEDLKKLCDSCFKSVNYRPDIQVVLQELHKLVFK